MRSNPNKTDREIAEQDKHWEALERLLAGHIPIPIAVTDGPEWAYRKLAQEVCSEIIALQKLATELVHTREERGQQPRAQRKEHLTERTQTLNQYRANIRQQQKCIHETICTAQRAIRDRQKTTKHGGTTSRSAQKKDSRTPHHPSDVHRAKQRSDNPPTET